MEEKKRNIRIDQDGTRHAPVPMWQELPQITVRLEEGHMFVLPTKAADIGCRMYGSASPVSDSCPKALSRKWSITQQKAEQRDFMPRCSN